jgi:hypothetical protein
MTTKAAFSPTEWQAVLEGPPTAGMIVVTASHGGMFRETIAMSKAYVEARAQHSESELLDEIVAEKPRLDPGDAARPTRRDIGALLLHDSQEPLRILDFSRSNSWGVMTPWSRRSASLVSSSAELLGPAASWT